MMEWMKSFVGYLLMVSVATQMLPSTKYEQYVRVFTGLLMIILLIQPVLKIGSADSYLEEKVTDVMMEQERLEKEITMQSETFKRESENFQRNDMKEIYIPEIDNVEVEVTMND